MTGKKKKSRFLMISILNFELIHRDEINVGYIISLLLNMLSAEPTEQEKLRKVIRNMLDTEAQLRSKKELIEHFIAEHFPAIPKDGNLRESFERYWNKEKEVAIRELGETEGLEFSGLRKVIDNYLFTEKTPLRDEIIDIMEMPPKLKERRTITERIIDKIKAFVETFIDGVD